VRYAAGVVFDYGIVVGPFVAAVVIAFKAVDRRRGARQGDARGS
jgi:hypothetical protein